MKITEENFLIHLKRRKEDALEFVIRQYGGRMKAVIRRILYAYPEDAEECLYDSFRKIWEHIESFDETKSTFANWSAGIAKYSALDRLRKLTKTEPMADIDDLQITADTQLTDNALFNGFFMELISCLSDEDKRLFIKIFWEGRSVSTVATELGKDKSVVYNRISRGKKKIIASNPELFRREEKI